ncbi:Holliday junction branch migration DNA helicase RuvB [Calditerrivibrio nitroreducens]|uniref:Holliday junction branch migration complex subunit RuvB n=1 Tax=Calditerrivibrio nitroreducens (strain DSM 19672 / NBRC 101217 / Yu37-1) TaxID=768670 RepID=E4THY0_CALNY|nr:Holliday junction branch migration DNA helicase RuvB [Calditerrivibrio nitroreducens]ADR18910.1 Holliday junction DNA helicase RuvB [Calditerrivibrio nitroreducens DSM 19672]
MNNDIFSKEKLGEDVINNHIRPKRFSEYVGQKKIIENLKIFVEAAKLRNEPLDHTLFYGPPGLGKTTLANIISNEMNVNIKSTSGPVIEKPGDLAAILTNLSEGDVLFIDEIHRLHSSVEEILYPAMEDFQLDIVIGQGPSARTIKIDLPKFTLVGATTRIGLLTSPLRDRFGMVFKLDFYSEEELISIIKRGSTILNCTIDESAAVEIAKRSRGTPRIAHRILRRVRDFAQVMNNGYISIDIAKLGLERLEIDEQGLDKADRAYLNTIIEKYDGGPVGLDTLSATLSEERDTLEDVTEPYLIFRGFIKKTPRGRIATKLAYEHLRIKYYPKALEITDFLEERDAED